MKVMVRMRDALADDNVLGRALPGPSWSSWRILLCAAAGEVLDDSEREVFKRLTGREKEPGHMCEVLLAVVGRRGGKSKAAAVFMVWLACCCDWTSDLSIGEHGIALIISPTERQSQVMADYIRAIIKNTPLLASLVEDETQQVFKLKRNVAIEILAANAKWVRGLTAIGIAMDETAYLPSNEDAANSDISILEAVRPSAATTAAPLVITSSPSTTQGIVHTLWKKHFGPDGSPDCIVVQSDSRGLNPTLRQSVVDKALADDAESASAEYLGQFREPLSAFISREIVMRCVEVGRSERLVLPGLEYQCFVDVSSGSGTDYFAAAIGHRARDDDRNVVVLDCLFAERPPFDPLACIAALRGHLERWRIKTIVGDAYAGNFVPSAFAKHGITYLPAKLSASELYLAALPVFTSGGVALLDNPVLIEQLVNLRRRIGQAGKESVQHMRGQHDDLANATCGLIHMLTPAEGVAWDYGGIGVVTQPRSYVGDGGEASETMQAWLATQNYTRAPDGGLGRGGSGHRPGSVVW
jgi:hypothetical protein